MDIAADTSSQEVVDAFTTGAGEVKYFRWCSKDGSDQRLALVEFTDYGAIPAAMRLNNTVLGESTIKVESKIITSFHVICQNDDKRSSQLIINETKTPFQNH